MRVFIAVLVLIFSFQSLSKADDIRDFEIEGMSIGDSLLDYFSEDEIKNGFIEDYYKYKSNKKYITVEFYELPFFKTYDGIHRTTFVIDENGIIIKIINKEKHE